MSQLRARPSVRRVQAGITQGRVVSRRNARNAAPEPIRLRAHLNAQIAVRDHGPTPGRRYVHHGPGRHSWLLTEVRMGRVPPVSTVLPAVDAEPAQVARRVLRVQWE
jgi:hypothetical protein